MQFISASQLHTALQVIVVMTKSGDSFDYARPAALSTESPKRHVGGFWKTPHCRAIERDLKIAFGQAPALTH